MTSAQHPASHIAAPTRSPGADIPALFHRASGALRAALARGTASFHAGDAFAAAGYSVLSLYAAGFVAYIATVY
ncbi:MAG: hypothetical protein KF714_11660 [Parvibaculum sp.]|jgi:hypothetical protein|nr:hypothetical protein [Parvibaculum sp.]